MRYFAFCQGDILLTKELSIPQGETAPFPIKPWQIITTLKGCDAQVIRLDSPVLSEDYVMMGLRMTFDVLPAEDYQLAGKCAELLYFDQNSKFCGCCGAPMKWNSDISKKCTNCGKELWPPLAIAVIVRVTRQISQPQTQESVSPSKGGEGLGREEILLVRANNFRGTHYGLVAGFVETGDTLEASVERELMEETHIKVRNIKYFGSQPWPYPCGLMVGFTAEYVEGDIQIQRSELNAAGWFTRDNLPEIPGKASIARQLIDDWLNA